MAENVRTFGGRLEGVVTFTLVRYSYGVFSSVLENEQLTQLCLWIVVLGAVLATIVSNPIIHGILKIFIKISVLMLNQSIISGVTESMHLHDLRLSLQTFVTLTGVLCFVFVFSNIIQLPEYTARGLTLLLYMYTDANNAFIKRFDMGYVGAFVFGGVYIALFIDSNGDKTDKDGLLNYFKRAVSMLSINILLHETANRAQESNLFILSSLMIIFLYIMDCLMAIDGGFTESRDFALWRTAQTMYELYQKEEEDELISLALVSLVFACHFRFWSGKHRINILQTLSELFSLMLVNVFLGSISNSFLQNDAMFQVVVMIMYVVVIHSATEVVLMSCS